MARSPFRAFPPGEPVVEDDVPSPENALAWRRRIAAQGAGSNVFDSFDADIARLVVTHGYWIVAVVAGLENMGVPVPGETVLIAAAIYAGATGNLDIGLVIAAATVGAIIGDNLGFWLGRHLGFRLLHRYGRFVGRTEGKIKLGQYLFLRHGGKVVFFGRFVTILRVLAALLAGANGMPWPRFLVANAAGAVVWAAVFGLGAYVLGSEIHHFKGPLGIAGAILAVLALGTGFVFLRRNEARLQAEAERALPGPLRRPGRSWGFPANRRAP